MAIRKFLEIDFHDLQSFNGSFANKHQRLPRINSWQLAKKAWQNSFAKAEPQIPRNMPGNYWKCLPHALQQHFVIPNGEFFICPCMGPFQLRNAGLVESIVRQFTILSFPKTS